MADAGNVHRLDLKIPTAGAGPMPRSQASWDFERTVRDLTRVVSIPRRSQIDLRRFARFARWMAIGEIHRETPAIFLRLAGSGFTEFFGFDLTNVDYLELVDPDIRQAAYESACALIDRPCGLWQMTPVATEDERPLSLEYTAFPLLNDATATTDILVFARHHFADELGYPRASKIRHAAQWEWIDLGSGVPVAPPMSDARAERPS
jgi:hypothetical protein